MFGNFRLGVPFSRTTHACRQDGRNVMCSDAVWEKENLSDRFLLICSRPWVFSVFPLMKSSSADLIRDSFQFVPQAFFWYSHIAFFQNCVFFAWAVHNTVANPWEVSTSCAVLCSSILLSRMENKSLSAVPCTLTLGWWLWREWDTPDSCATSKVWKIPTHRY